MMFKGKNSRVGKIFDKFFHFKIMFGMEQVVVLESSLSLSLMQISLTSILTGYKT